MLHSIITAHSTHTVGETNTIGGFIERMWAYMTIQKLLNDAQSGLLSDSDKQDKQQQALQLSLKVCIKWL
jgi:hypothetical protein